MGGHLSGPGYGNKVISVISLPPGSWGWGVPSTGIREISCIAGQGPGAGSHMKCEMGPRSPDHSVPCLGRRCEAPGDSLRPGLTASFCPASAEASPPSLLPVACWSSRRYSACPATPLRVSPGAAGRLSCIRTGTESRPLLLCSSSHFTVCEALHSHPPPCH